MSPQRRRDSAFGSKDPLKDPSVLDAAGALYLTGTRAKGKPLDQVVAAFLRDAKTAKWSHDDAARGFVVDTAQGMWRARRRLEASLTKLPFEATRGAMAALYLVGARAIDAASLPIDRNGAGALADAWNATATAKLDVRASLPSWLVDVFVGARGATEGEALCLSFLQTPPTSLRANTLKTTRDDLIASLASEGIRASVSQLSPDGVVLAARANVHRTQAFKDGFFEVQDEGSQLVSRLAAVQPGMVVVDACAGAGGKTLHLAALMKGKGTIHAFDVATHRLDALRERAKRAGAHNIRVHALALPRSPARPGTRGDGRDVERDVQAAQAALAKVTGNADVVLIDAPCTGTGVLRRNPDTAWSLTPADAARLVAEQARILDTYAPLVKNGGRLVYATCSLLEEENGGTITSFLERHPTFTRVRAREVLDAQGVGVGDDVLALDPLRHGTDGFYACALDGMIAS